MTKSFDVFLSHNSQDKPAVRELAAALRARGLRVWMDETELVPGRPWQPALEATIKTTRSAAVLIGKNGLGSWEKPEMWACLGESVKRKLPVIPVLLPTAPRNLELPMFLQNYTWVDLRGGLTEAGVDKVAWGITGVKPDRIPAHSKPPFPRLGLAVAGGLAVLSITAYLVWPTGGGARPASQHAELELARQSMAGGRYPEAARHFQQAQAVDADKPEAVFGAKKAQLAEQITHAPHDDPARFQTELNVLRQAAPNDADLSLLEGDLLARERLPASQAKALQKYQEALAANPRLAEAHFRLGIFSARAGDADAALRHYKEADQLAPHTEKYQGNLAEQYLQHGDYALAITLYESLDEYPLGWLEAAKAHWARGEVRQALERQTRALQWLNDSQVAALPKNQLRWRLDLSDSTSFSVVTPACQQYYATLAQAASQFMLDGAAATPPAAADCGHAKHIRQALAWDLRRYALVQPGQAQASQTFIDQRLARSP